MDGPNATDDPPSSGSADDSEESVAGARDEPGVEGGDEQLCAGVVTIATDRSLESDAAGEAVVTAIREADHEVTMREHVASDYDRVQSIATRVIEREDTDVVITAGGTSVEPGDVTIEAVEPLLEKQLSAFGDLFTRLAYDEIGTRVVAARTLAGVAERTPVFCLPGNADAARLAATRIILPEARNLVDVARIDDGGTDVE